MKNDQRILKRNILACYLSDVILGTYFQLPIWIAYQSQFLTYNKIALFSGIALISEVIFQLPTGAFADLFGRKVSLALGNLFMALPMFLLAFFPGPQVMLAYALMWGLGRAFCMGTSKPILYETMQNFGEVKKYPSILSRSVVCFQLSAAISIVAGGYLYQISHNLPYIFSGIFSLIGVFTSQLFIEIGERESSFKLQKFVSTASAGFVEIFKNSFVTKLTILYALTLGIAQTSQQFFAQPYMVELGMNDIQRSWVAMIIKISIAFLGAKILSNIKFAEHKYFLLIIPVFMVISQLPAGVVKLPWAFLLFVGIAFNSGNADLFLSPEINHHLSSSIRSTAISLQRMLASSFGAVVQWISIAVVAGSSIGTFYSYLGLFSLFVIVPLALLLTRHKHALAST